MTGKFARHLRVSVRVSPLDLFQDIHLCLGSLEVPFDAPHDFDGNPFVVLQIQAIQHCSKRALTESTHHAVCSRMSATSDERALPT